MDRPQSGCITFMVLDFIRVPLPAARTITATARLTPGLLSSRSSSPGRSRTYVASPDSKSGGPCRQTNRGSAALSLTSALVGALLLARLLGALGTLTALVGTA